MPNVGQGEMRKVPANLFSYCYGQPWPHVCASNLPIETTSKPKTDLRSAGQLLSLPRSSKRGKNVTQKPEGGASRPRNNHVSAAPPLPFGAAAPEAPAEREARRGRSATSCPKPRDPERAPGCCKFNSHSFEV